MPKMVLQNLVGSVPSPKDPLTLASVKAQVARHRERILRLNLLNTRQTLLLYINARAGKPPPRPPDPKLPVSSTSLPVPCPATQNHLASSNPDHLCILASKTGSWKNALITVLLVWLVNPLSLWCSLNSFM